MPILTRRRAVPSLLCLSAAGLLGIALHEGYRERTYTDAVGVPTIGYGSTRIDGAAPAADARLDPVRALVQLASDVDSIEQALRACVGPVPLYPYEWNAYVSLAYNIGPAAFCRSTLVRRLRADPPDYAGACNEITRWNRAGGRVLTGLVKRRAAEHQQCLGNTTGNPEGVLP